MRELTPPPTKIVMGQPFTLSKDQSSYVNTFGVTMARIKTAHPQTVEGYTDAKLADRIEKVHAELHQGARPLPGLLEASKLYLEAVVTRHNALKRKETHLPFITTPSESKTKAFEATVLTPALELFETYNKKLTPPQKPETQFTGFFHTHAKSANSTPQGSPRATAKQAGKGGSESSPLLVQQQPYIPSPIQADQI